MMARKLLMFVFVSGLFVTFLTSGIYKARAGMVVYDGNNQYLGVLAGKPTSVIPVFVPAMSCILRISTETGYLYDDRLFYNSQDCTGTGYVRSDHMYFLHKVNGEYFTGEREAPVRRKMESEELNGSQCSSGYYCDPCGGYYYSVPIKTISRSDIPMRLPVRLPMSIKYRSEGNDCISVGADLSLAVPCADYGGTQYGFTLSPYNNPYDSSGLYWKMDKSTLVVK
jgi:hypothetical protein